MKKLILTSLFLLGVVSQVNAEVVLTAPDRPWETNKPYLDDEYTAKYEAERKRLENLGEKEAAKKCRKLDYDCEVDIIIKYQDQNKYPARGTVEYVNANFLYMKKDLKKYGKKLKQTLRDLHELSLKTRSVNVFEKKKKGELTYEEVSREICFIEQRVGYFPKEKYCDAY